MEFKGTKEKWEVFTDSYTNEITIYPSDSTVAICSMANTYERNKYDALLISKAPEMLEMLKKCKMMCEHLNIHHVSTELNTLIKEATEL